MKRALILIILFVATLSLGADPGSEEVWLRSAKGFDLEPRILAPPVLVPRAIGTEEDEDRSAESSSRLLDPDGSAELSLETGSLQAGPPEIGSLKTVSRGYRLKLEPARLRVGTRFHTVVPGATVGLVGLEEGDFEILAGDQVFTGADALDPISAEERAGLPSSAAVVGKLSPKLGTGRLILRGSSSQAGAPLELFVEEPASPLTLVLSLQRDRYLHGQVLQGSLRLVRQGENGEEPVPTLKAEANLEISGGARQPVRLVPNPVGGYSLRMPLDARNTILGQDWTLQVQAVGMVEKQQVVRGAAASFRVAFASARFDEPVLVSRASGAGVTLVFPIETSVSGRFSLTGVLHEAGEDVPQALAEARSEAWLDAGKSRLALVFGAEVFPKGLPEGPLEIRDLRLEDLSRNSLVQSRAVGLVLE